MPVINRPVTSSRPAPPVRKPFSQWTLQDAQNAVQWIRDKRVGQDGFLANQAYAQDHDHWQDAGGWIGPQGGEEMVTRSRVKLAVERQFTPVDAIGEVLDNIANALLQNKARVALEPLVPAEKGSKEEETQQQEATDLLAPVLRWCEDRELWMKAREVVKRSRWSTWGTLRTWIPESAVVPQVDETERTGFQRMLDRARQLIGQEEPDKGEQQTTVPLPSGLDLEEALGKIFLSAPGPEQGFVYVDPDTQRRVGIFLYRDEKEDFAELCWVNDQGLTVSRLISKRDTDEVSNDLGKRLPMNMLAAELLITEPVRMQQAQLNFANSIMTRVMETAGFPERYVKDAMPEGEWVDSPPSSTKALLSQTDKQGKEWYLVPTQRTLGAGVVNDIRGLVDEDTDGKVHARVPDVIKFEPTDPAYIIGAIRAARGTILRQCKQGHIEMDDQATATGWSRVQARASHLADVTNMRDPLVELIRGTLEAVLAYAALMSPEAADILARFRVSVTVHITLGPVDPEERTAILEMLKAGAISLPTALTLLQVDDVAGEIERIRSQPESQRAQLKDQVEIGSSLIGGWGLDAVTVAELVGLPDEMVRIIKKAVTLAEEQAQQIAGQVDAQGNPIPPNGGQPANQPANQPPARQQRGAAA